MFIAFNQLFKCIYSILSAIATLTLYFDVIYYYNNCFAIIIIITKIMSINQ